MMRIPKKSRQAFLAHFEGKANVSKEELVHVAKYFLPQLDIKALINKEYGEIANRIIKGPKDKDGCAEWYALREDGKTRYINIDNCDDRNELTKISNSMTKQYSGVGAGLRKVKRRLWAVTGLDTKLIPLNQEEPREQILH